MRVNDETWGIFWGVFMVHKGGGMYYNVGLVEGDDVCKGLIGKELRISTDN